jgi:hypothetical protein
MQNLSILCMVYLIAFCVKRGGGINHFASGQSFRRVGRKELLKCERQGVGNGTLGTIFEYQNGTTEPIPQP